MDHAEAFTSLECLCIRAGGNHDHIDRLSSWLQNVQANRQSIQFRHIDIEDHDIGMEFTSHDQRLKAVAGRLHLETHLCATARDESCDARIVVGDQRFSDPAAGDFGVHHKSSPAV